MTRNTQLSTRRKFNIWIFFSGICAWKTNSELTIRLRFTKFYRPMKFSDSTNNVRYREMIYVAALRNHPSDYRNGTDMLNVHPSPLDWFVVS